MYKVIERIFGSPAQNETGHAGRILLISVGVVISAIVGGTLSKGLIKYPVTGCGYAPSFFAVFLGLCLALTVLVFALVLGTFLGWVVGGILDRRTSPKLQRHFFYCTQIWFLAVGSLGIGWSIRGIAEGRLPLITYLLGTLISFWVAVSTLDPIRKRIPISLRFRFRS